MDTHTSPMNDDAEMVYMTEKEQDPESTKSREQGKSTFKRLGVRASRATSNFFGVTPNPKTSQVNVWNQRRLRMAAAKFGNIKADMLPGVDYVDGAPARIPLTPRISQLLPDTPVTPKPNFLVSARDGLKGLRKRPTEERVVKSRTEPDGLFPRPHRFPFLKNFMGLLTCHKRKDPATAQIVHKIDPLSLYRPYFTFWVCTVQVVIFVATLIMYGIAPVGHRVVSETKGDVMQANLAIESVCRVDYDNLWIGPDQAALIRVGARYSPCMRADVNLIKWILRPQIDKERNSACCIRNDGGGCYQSTSHRCSDTLSTWVNRSGNSLKSTSVCGQDPDYCTDPVSQKPFEWPTDITQWQICRQTSKPTGPRAPHMQCDLTGGPCCVGIKGECIVTSPEHCSFMRGYFHSEAALCSQVNCLNEICGMLSFHKKDSPDQFYRVFTSLFVHAGLFHLLLTLLVQLWFMRSLEMMVGCLRIALVYFLSGCLGSITSGIFLPYLVEAGPSGAHFGLLGMTFVELILDWPLLENPWIPLGKYMLLMVCMFLIGLLPWIDNYAHLFGFISGVVLSFVFLPWVNVKSGNRTKRIISIVVSSLVWIGLLVAMLLLFYVYPIVNCSWCKYFNCVPLADRFCDNMEVNITSRTDCLLF